MWKRYNQASHIWELSSNNGASWSQMPVNAAAITEGNFPEARMPAAVAYTNRDNVFSPQTIGENTIIRGNNGLFNLQATGAPSGSKNLRTVNYSNIDWRFEFLSDDGASVLANPLSILSDNRVSTGPLTVSGDLNVNSNIGVAGSVYEQHRGTPLGYWIDVPFDAGNYFTSNGATFSGVNQVVYSYSLVGKMMHIFLYFAATCTTSPTWLGVNLPIACNRQIAAPVYFYNPPVINGIGVLLSNSGESRMIFYKNVEQGAWTVGPVYIVANFSMSIA